MANETIMRFQIADYLGSPGDSDTTYALMGAGFNTLDENPAAQLDTKAYINDKAASSIVKGYQPQFPFDTDLIKSEEAVMELYKIGRDELTGADAERDYIRVELFEPVASKKIQGSRRGGKLCRRWRRDHQGHRQPEQRGNLCRR